MTFVTTSLAIAGIAAASIPILVHLLLRRRRRPMAWAAMTPEQQAERAAFEELRAERRREATLRRRMDAEANAQVQREEEERLWRADAARRPATPEGWTPPADGGESDGWSD